jgi:large subunit ribosomal protein LP2
MRVVGVCLIQSAVQLLAVANRGGLGHLCDADRLVPGVFAGGVEVDSSNVSKFLKEVEGKSLDELLAAGREKLASMPTAGAAPAGGGGAAAAGGAPAAAGGKPEEKKVEEESEEEVCTARNSISDRLH